MTLKYQVCAIAPNCWHGDGSAIIESDCGHAHRSMTAAARCMYSLKFSGCEPGMWRAAWHHAAIRHADHTALSDAECELADDAYFAVRHPH